VSTKGKHKISLVIVAPDSPHYPIGVKEEFVPAPQLVMLGTWPLTGVSSVALLSSAKAPASILLAIHDLAQHWRRGSRMIISGFHSPVEQEAFEVLLRGPAPIIYCPARNLPKRLKPAWRSALEAGRLTMLSPFPESVRRASKKTAIYRNRLVAALAGDVLIAYAHPGSSTEQLAREVLAWGKPLYALDHPANEGLITLGAQLWPAGNSE